MKKSITSRPQGKSPVSLMLLLAALLFVACAHAPKQGAPSDNKASWPIALFEGDYPDPSILVDGDDYYMTFTTNYWLPSLVIWHSRDLINWEPIGHALDQYLGTVWAPDFQKVGDRYYIYFPADGKIYVVWADDVRGPWSEPVDLHIGAIDPGLIVDAEGNRCLYVNGGRMIRLAPDGLSTVGELQAAYNAWPIPDTWEVECTCLESPKLTQRDGWYYLTSAEGGTAGPATSHMAVVHRSRSIEGPWEPCPQNPVIHTWSADEPWWSKGHGTLFEDAHGQWWMVYHAYRKGFYTLGRHTLLSPIEWTADGWPVEAADAQRTLPARSAKRELMWQTWKGNEEIQTAVVGDTCYTLRARVSVSNDESEGGLLLSYSKAQFTGLTTDGHVLRLWHQGKLVSEQPNTWGSTVWMQLTNDCNTLTICAGPSARKLEPLGEPLDVSAMHHNNLGSFMSLRPALKQSGECVIDKISYTTH